MRSTSGRGLAEYGTVLGLVLVMSLAFAYYVLSRFGVNAPGGLASSVNALVFEAGSAGFSRGGGLSMTLAMVWACLEALLGTALLVAGVRRGRARTGGKGQMVAGFALVLAAAFHAVTLLLDVFGIVLPTEWFTTMAGWVVLITAVLGGFLAVISVEDAGPTEAALLGAACAVLLTLDMAAFSGQVGHQAGSLLAGFVLGSVFLGAVGGVLASIARKMTLA
jgi:hypothetical protein